MPLGALHVSQLTIVDVQHHRFRQRPPAHEQQVGVHDDNAVGRALERRGSGSMSGGAM